MGDRRLSGGVPAMSRRRTVLVVLAVLAAMVLSTGCSHGPRVRAGNLKEKREKKRMFQDAQRQALEAERLPESAEQSAQPDTEMSVTEAEPEPAVQDAPPGAALQPASPEPARVDSVPEGGAVAPLPQPDYSQDRCRITLRRPDGSEVSRLLYQPSFGYMERTYRTTGGVADHEHSMPMFRFQVGLSLHKVKFRNLERMEFIEVPDTRTQVRFRFFFRKGRQPAEFPAEQLVGASHPQIPVLQGVGIQGLERYPLFHLGGGTDSLRLVEVDFSP